MSSYHTLYLSDVEFEGDRASWSADSKRRREAMLDRNPLRCPLKVMKAGGKIAVRATSRCRISIGTHKSRTAAPKKLSLCAQSVSLPAKLPPSVTPKISCTADTPASTPNTLPHSGRLFADVGVYSVVAIDAWGGEEPQIALQSEQQTNIVTPAARAEERRGPRRRRPHA